MSQTAQSRFDRNEPGGGVLGSLSNQKGALIGTAILTLAYLLAYCDRTIVTILVGPLKKDLGFSDSQVALLIGFSFAIFYSVAGLPLGRLTDAVNRRNLIIAAIVCWSTATAACGLLNRFPTLLLARVCVGIGEACLVPAALSMIADYYGPRGRAKAIAMFVCGAPLGSGLAYLLGGTLLYRLQGSVLPHEWAVLTRFPWQLIFLLLGLLGLIVAALLGIISEPPRRFEVLAHEDAHQKESMRRLFASNKGLLVGVILGPAIMSIAFYALLAWGPTMAVRKFGWGPQQIALWFTPLGIVSGLLGPWVGAGSGTLLIRSGHSDGLMRAAVYIAAAAMPLCVAATMIPFGGVGIALMFISMGLLIAGITLPQVAIQYIMPNDLRGQVTALFVFCANIIGFGLGPTIVATLTDHVFHRDSSLNLSLAIVCEAALLIGGLMTLLHLSHYRAYVATGPRGRAA
jgi:MFS family permease